MNDVSYLAPTFKQAVEYLGADPYYLGLLLGVFTLPVDLARLSDEDRVAEEVGRQSDLVVMPWQIIAIA